MIITWPIPMIIVMRFASGFATFAMYEVVPLWLISDPEVGFGSLLAAWTGGWPWPGREGRGITVVSFRPLEHSTSTKAKRFLRRISGLLHLDPAENDSSASRLQCEPL